MQIVDTGVLTPSFMDFSLTSEFAKTCAVLLPQFGQFICNMRLPDRTKRH